MALKFYFLFFSAAILVFVSLPTLECFDLSWYLRWFPEVPLANKTSDIVNISSSVKIPNELPTEYLQDKLLLSNQTTAKTTVREENTTKGDVLAVTLTLAMTCHTPLNCCLRHHIDGKSSRCIECIPGYFGPYCNYTCRYPTYGRGCQLQCLCDVSDCNYVQGCRRKDCPSGYYGPFCSEKCRYPNYGIKCQSECLCEEQHCYHITGCLTLNITDDKPIYIKNNSKQVSSKEMPNALPTEFKRQDRLMLSNQTTTTLRKESMRKRDEWYLQYQEDKSWRVNKVFVYCIIGLMFIAVLLLCLHVLLYFVK